MRYIAQAIPVFIITFALLFIATSGSACHSQLAPVGPAIGSAGSCELNVLETQAKDVGQDVTIGTAIFSAIASGGATLPALFAAIEADLGPGTAKCAAQLADALETMFEAKGSGETGAPMLRLQGHAALRALMKQKGW